MCTFVHIYTLIHRVIHFGLPTLHIHTFIIHNFAVGQGGVTLPCQREKQRQAVVYRIYFREKTWPAMEKTIPSKQSHIRPNKRSSQWHSPLCHHHCRCNDSWENSSRDELAGYKSPLLQDISPKLSLLFLRVFAEVYECLLARGRAWLCVCVSVCGNTVDHYLNIYHRIPLVDSTTA